MSTSPSLSEKSKRLSMCIWQNTFEYSKSTNSPKNLGFLILIWTALYFCVLDIVQKNSIEYEMRKQFLETTCCIFNIDINDEHVLNSLLEIRKALLEDLNSLSLDPHSKGNIQQVHSHALSLARSISKSSENDVPDSSSDMEFLFSVFSVTKSASELFPNQTNPSDSLTNSCSSSSHKANAFSYPSSKNISNDRRLILLSFVIIVFAITSLIIFLSNLDSYNTESPRLDTSKSISFPNETNTIPELISQPEPSDGYVFEEISFLDCVSPLRINTVGDEGYYFVIDPIIFKTDGSDYEIETSKKLADISKFKFYVRGGSSFDLKVPLGLYEIYYATGNNWFGEDNLFGPETIYHKCGDTFQFSEDIDGYSGWTLTLYPVPNGNLETEIINESDFPK